MTSRSQFDQVITWFDLTQNHSRDSTKEAHDQQRFVARKGPVWTWQLVLVKCSCISHECTVENVRPSFMACSKRPGVLGDVFSIILILILVAAIERQYCNVNAVNGVASVRLRCESSLAESGNSENNTLVRMD